MVKRQRDRKHIDMIHCLESVIFKTMKQKGQSKLVEQITLDVKTHQQSVCVGGGGVLLDSSHARNGQGWGI